MLKNKDSHLKKLAIEYEERYSTKKLETILFVRRLNNMGYVIVKSDDLKKLGILEDVNIKDTVVPWLNLFNKKETDK